MTQCNGCDEKAARIAELEQRIANQSIMIRDLRDEEVQLARLVARPDLGTVMEVVEKHEALRAEVEKARAGMFCTSSGLQCCNAASCYGCFNCTAYRRLGEALGEKP